MQKNKINIIQIIKKSPSAKVGIQRVKQAVQLKEINSTFKQVLKLSYYKKSLLGNILPKTVDDFPYSSIVFTSADFEKELTWASNIFRIYADKINRFNYLRKGYLKELLSLNYISANEFLDKIEQELGVSLWLIENRISLIQLSEGLEKQKSFTTKIIENENANMTYRFLTRYLSIKAEKNVAPDKYDREIKSLYGELDELPYKDAYLNYLKFKVNIADIDNFRYQEVLQIETELSLIDRYLTFIEILLNLKAKNQLNLKLTTINQIWNNIKNIKDENLENLWRIEFGELNEEFILLSGEVIKILDLYTLGKYNQVVNLCEEVLNESPYVTELYEVYVKSLISSKRTTKFIGSLLHKIIINLSDLYQGGKVSEESYMDLLKMSYMFSMDLWAKKLRGISITAFYGVQKDKLNSYALISESISSIVGSKLLQIIHRDKAKDIVNSYLKVIASSVTLKLQKNFIEENITEIINMNLPKDREIRYLGDVYFNKKDYLKALELYNLVLSQKEDINKLEIISKKIISNIELGERELSLELFVNHYFDNPNIIFKINLADLISRLELNKINKKNLNIPIIYHLYCVHVSDDKEGTRNDSFEEFLEAWEVTKPSDLDLTKFEQEKIYYFFYNICTPGIMATSILFDSQLDVEDERLSICQKMSNIDLGNAIEYTKEIKNITKSRMVRKGIREVEKSKIYVDIEGIKNSLQKTIKENFVRYKSFDFDNNNSTPNYILIDKEINLMLPGDEKWNLFSTMVIEIRDSFVSSKEYGLDGYLSVGIRHGTLSGQLRGIIESENLITQIEASDKNYQDNVYWLNKIEIVNEKMRVFLRDQLNDFSKGIDTLISRLKNEAPSIILCK